MTATAYVTRPLPSPGVSALAEAGLRVLQHERDEPPSRGELLEGAGEADGLLCLLTDRVDEDLLDASPRLRIIANLAVGFDNIDIDAARRRGIVVTNTPDVLVEATAELAWAALLAVARQLLAGDRLVRSGEWRGWSPTQLLGTGLHGRTLGIVGMGAIGCAVARRAAAFGMRIVYCNRTPSPCEAAVQATRLSLEQLLRCADVVTLHAPLTRETHHMVDAAALESMKADAILVNTARGPLVDEGALVDALRHGRIGGAALDVFEHEPQVCRGLRELDNAVLLPHLGSATHEARAAMVRLCCDNILAVLSGLEPLTPIGQPAQ